MYVYIYISIYLFIFIFLFIFILIFIFIFMFIFISIFTFIFIFIHVYIERERCTCTYVWSSNFSVVEALGIAIRHVQIKSSMKQIEPLLHSNFDIFFDMGHGPQVQFVQRFRMKEDPKLTDFTNTKHTKSGTPTPHRDPFYIYCVWLK